MRLIFAGTPEAAVPTLRALLESEHEVCGVISQPDRPKGRGRQIEPTPVAAIAHHAHIPLLQPERIDQAIDAIAAWRADLAIVVAYGALLKKPLLDLLPWINLHFSLLPAYRGAAPVHHALLRGEEITGTTTFLLDAGMDSGPILGQMTEAIRPDDTSGSLTVRLAEHGSQLVLATVDAWQRGELTPVAQDLDGISYAPKISKEMARIDWQAPSTAIDRHVRAMSPSPAAWTTVDGQPMIIEQVSTDDFPPLQPGVAEVLDGRVLCGTGSSAIEIVRVRPAGKRSMLATEWVRGFRGDLIFQ